MACTRSVASLLRHSSRNAILRTAPQAAKTAPCTRSLAGLAIKNTTATQHVLRLPSCSTVCASRSLATSVSHLSASSANDEDLSSFLREEIEFEHNNMEQIPSRLRDFSLNMSGTEVTLTRNVKGETVTVLFDINDNRNVDETPEGDEEVDGAIVSYPEFTVSIAKASGKILQFSCVYEASEYAEEEGEAQQHNEEEQKNFDMFKFDHVSIVEDGQDEEGVYESETTNMDPNLYGYLMDMMAERGIDAEFVQEMLQYSTAAEHKHYVNFLQDLKKFVDSK